MECVFYHENGGVYSAECLRLPQVGDWVAFDEVIVVVAGVIADGQYDVADHPRRDAISRAMLNPHVSPSQALRDADAVARSGKSWVNTHDVEDVVVRAATSFYGDEYGNENGYVECYTYFENGHWCVSVMTGSDAFDGEIVCHVVDADPGIDGTGFDLVQIS